MISIIRLVLEELSNEVDYLGLQKTQAHLERYHAKLLQNDVIHQIKACTIDEGR